MRTSFIQWPYRVGINDNQLFVFDDVRDQTVLSVSNIQANKDELQVRGIPNQKEFMRLVILSMVAEELQVDSITIDHLL